MGDKYKKIELIGSGTFGRVWLVQVEKTKRKYAIKEIQVAGMSSKDKDQALIEVSALGRCKHVNIIRYKEAFVERGMLNIAMEYADGGDLHSKIKRQKGVYFAEQIALDWYTQICFALRYIHGRNILHRDLKTQNIFLTKNNTIKIGDFGIAKILQDTSDHARTAIGTPYYLSPEICQRKPYNHKSDIWASGCVLYELVCLTHPFDGMNFSDLVLKIMQGQYKSIPSHYSALVEDLISILLRVNATKRPSARQILCIPGMQPNVNAYISRVHHLHDNVCNSIASMSIMNKSKAKEPAEERCFQLDDEKENVSPETSTILPKRPRKHSLSTPKVEDVMKDKRPNSAESSNNKAKRQNKISAKSSPKYSLYMDIVRKQREQSPLASLLLKPRPNLPNEASKPEPRLSLCEFIKSGQDKKTKRPFAEIQTQNERKSSVDGKGVCASSDRVPSDGKQVPCKPNDSTLESLRQVDKEIDRLKDRISRRKQSMGMFCGDRERAGSESEVDNLVKDVKTDPEKPERSKRPHSHDRRAHNKRTKEDTDNERDGSCDERVNSDEPGAFEMPKELLQVGRRDPIRTGRGRNKLTKEDTDKKRDGSNSDKPGAFEMPKELLQVGRRDSIRTGRAGCEEGEGSSRYRPQSKILSTDSTSDFKTESKVPEVDRGGAVKQGDRGKVSQGCTDFETGVTKSTDVPREIGEKKQNVMTEKGKMELREIGKNPRPGCTENIANRKDENTSNEAPKEGETRCLEPALGSNGPRVCGKTFKVEINNCAGEVAKGKTYNVDLDERVEIETQGSIPTLPTVIFREEVPGPPAISQTEVTSLLHKHSITDATSLLHQAESLRYQLETKMGCENFMTAYQMLKDALSSDTPVDEFSPMFSSYMGYHPVIFWLIQLEAVSHLK